MTRHHLFTLSLVSVSLVAGCKARDQSLEGSSASGVELINSAVAAPPTAAPPAELDPPRGAEIGMEFEAFLSPDQEPGEEADTPKAAPQVFRSTTASKTRAQRVADGHRGHAKVRFSKDLSRAWVDVQLEGVDVSTINMFHIHCGQPGILGPILVDFAHVTDIQQNFGEDGRFSVELGNAAIVDTVDHGHGLIGAFAAGCLIKSPSLELAPSKVSTVAGMAHIAREGELYFNLHTTGQTYFGDVRGQLYMVE